MSNIIKQLEAEQVKKKIPAFKSGDTIVVQVRVQEGNRERLQAFEGVVIAKRNRGLNSAFTVRKISHGEGVERIFQTYSPLIESITVKRHGAVRKSKLYYLRELTGRKARIKEEIGRKNFDADMLIAETEEAPGDEGDVTPEDSVENVEQAEKLTGDVTEAAEEQTAAEKEVQENQDAEEDAAK